MGFLDRDVHSGLDKLFDHDHDGMISPREQADEFAYLQMMEDDMEDDEEEFTESLDFEFLDDDEKREYLEENGYDEEDFGFDSYDGDWE